MPSFVQTWIFSCLYIIFVLSAFPLCTLTPRLLITLGCDCDFSAIVLAQNIEGRVVTGSEEEIGTQILESDLSDQTHLVILDPLVQDLSAFASRFFYDYICLNDKWDVALTVLKEKISTVPVTDADLERITPEERGQFYNLIAKVSVILNDHKIPFWAISGTLLGAVRHGGMVPWDDDLDIIVRIRDKQRFEKLAAILNDNGLQLFIYHNYFYKIFPKDGRPVYAEDGSTYSWKYPFLDVFVVNELNDKIRIVSHNYPSIDLYPANGDCRGWWLCPHEIRLPPLFLPFGPIQIPVPHDPQAILTREYGLDWFAVAYMWYNHATEMMRKRVKVTITDYSPPEYVLPKGE